MQQTIARAHGPSPVSTALGMLSSWYPSCHGTALGLVQTEDWEAWLQMFTDVGAACLSVILYLLIPVTRCHKDLVSELPGELLYPESYSRQLKIIVIPGERPVLG